MRWTSRGTTPKQSENKVSCWSRLRGLRSERGAVMVMVAGGIVGFFAMAAFVLDFGQIYVARAQLQSAADSAAAAAAWELPSPAQTQDLAIDYADANDGGHGPILVPSDVTVGFWNGLTRTFVPNGNPKNAVHVVARRSVSNGNPIETFFAGVLGFNSFEVTAEAIAARDISADVVILQDVTVSFQEEISIAVDADKALIDAFAIPYPDTVQMGVVSFARSTTDVSPLGMLNATAGAAKAALDNMSNCTAAGGPGGPCYGTDIGIGLDRARAMLQAGGRPNVEKVIVLISDGLPCIGELPVSQWVPAGQVLATDAANAAAAADISIFSVTLYEAGGGSGPCSTSDITFNESLARGLGFGTTTTDPAQLEAILTSIVQELPPRLVS